MTRPRRRWTGAPVSARSPGAYVPGGLVIDLPYGAYAERIARTRQALDEGAPAVYEAAFRADGVFVAVDILARDNRGFRLVEVKSSASVKEHHIPDVAMQAHVLRRNGLELVGTEVMHLNRECTYPDLSNLFVRADVTEAVRAAEASVPRWLAQQVEALQGPVPKVAIGPHCTSPYECPFMARCWPTLPPHHVSTLYAMRRRALELDEQGYQTIHDLPEDVPLGADPAPAAPRGARGPDRRGAHARASARELRAADRLPRLRGGGSCGARVAGVPPL